MEEAAELVDRIENGGRLPMLTSCCPGWVNFFEHEFPDLLDIPSTCKSPQQMFGAIAKSYYAKKMRIDPKDLVVVSVMPCLAKKYEAARPEMKNDVDIVVSTREIAKMMKEAGIQFNQLQDEEFIFNIFSVIAEGNQNSVIRHICQVYTCTDAGFLIIGQILITYGTNQSAGVLSVNLQLLLVYRGIADYQIFISQSYIG